MKEHLNYLDGLRGLACIMVAASHFYALFGAVFWGTDFLADKLDFFYNGTWCVRMFFMVSAFLVSAALYRSISVEKIEDTLIKRYLRLTLPVLAVTFVIWIMGQFQCFYNMNLTEICSDTDYTGGYTETHAFYKVFTTSLFTTIFQGDISFNNKYWMMTYLFYGNIMSMIITIVTQHRKRINHFLFAFFIVAVLITQVYYFPFVLGTLLAYWYTGDKKRISNPIVWSGVFVIGLIITEFKGYLIQMFEMVDLGNISELAFLQDGNFYNTIAIFLIILAVMKLKILQRILGFKPFKALGRISYYVFLIHWPIMCSLSSWLYLKYCDDAYSTNIVRIIFVISMVVVLLSSWLLTITYDRYCTKFTNWILNKKNGEVHS